MRRRISVVIIVVVQSDDCYFVVIWILRTPAEHRGGFDSQRSLLQTFAIDCKPQEK